MSTVYASTIWSPWQNVLIISIEKIQRRTARYVVNDYNPYSTVTNHLIDLNWKLAASSLVYVCFIRLFITISQFHSTYILNYPPARIQDSQIIINSYKYPCRKNLYLQSFFQIQLQFNV